MSDGDARGALRVRGPGGESQYREGGHKHDGPRDLLLRSPIPYDRDKAGIGPAQQYWRHIGIYAYRKDFLLQITKLPQTPLEKLEKLEQLRAIENGFAILVGKVDRTRDGIDTPEQYAAFVERYRKKGMKE